METAFGCDLVIPRKQLKPFTRRSDRMGLIYITAHLATLGATGWLVYLAQSIYWLIPAMFLHGTVMTFLFAPMHETSHGTAFRSRWLNEAVFRLVSVIYISPPIFFRYFHAAHHTYTQVRGSDPDIVLPEHATFGDYLLYCSSLLFWRRNLGWFFRHAMGRMHPRDSWYVPENEKRRIYFEARVMLLFYSLIAGGAVVIGTWAPLIYWIIPRLMGEPVMRWIRVTEHSGCEEGPDLRTNTRTTRATRLLKALFWNMPYHAEHHLSPSVPFHALPALHDEVGDQLHEVGSGYFAVHGEVIRMLLAGRPLSPSRREETA